MLVNINILLYLCKRNQNELQKLFCKDKENILKRK